MAVAVVRVEVSFQLLLTVLQLLDVLLRVEGDVFVHLLLQEGGPHLLLNIILVEEVEGLGRAIVIVLLLVVI